MGGPTRLDTLKNLRLSLADVSMSTAFGSLFGGAFLVAFVQACHGGDAWLGFLTAIGSLLGVLQIPGAIWGRGFAAYKRFVWPGGLAWRLMYVPIVFLPILAIEGQAKLFIAAALIIIGASAVQVVNPIYTDWLAEIVPTSSRGSYFTKRSGIATGVGSAIGIVGGVILDFFQRRQNGALGLTIIFGLGIACGMLSYWFFWQMKDNPRPKPIRQPVWEGIKTMRAPFRSRSYRPVLIYLAVAVFATGVPSPFYAAFALDSLKLPFTIVMICGAMQSLSIVLFSPLVGFFSDRYGNKPLLVIGGVLIAINPILWVFAREGHVTGDTIYLLMCHPFFGIGWAIMNPGQGNLMLNTAPPEDRANHLGAGNAVIAIINGVAPMVGAGIIAACAGLLHHNQGNLYRLLFIISAVLRLAAVFFLIPVREKGAVRLRTTLSQITSASPRTMRAARRLENALTPDEKEAVMADLARKPNAMGVEGLAASLADPLPRVRRGAAQAIGRIIAGTSQVEVASAIVSHIRANPDMVEEETLEALEAVSGLGEPIPGAAACLTDLLHSPRGPIRRAAAHALGRLGLDQAVAPLCEAAESDDADLCRAALQALRILGDTSAGPTLVRALRNRHPSVSTAAAEAVSELQIVEAAPVLREILAEEDIRIEGVVFRPISALAYALGAVGARSDLPHILAAGQKTIGRQARRAVLLGAAKLLGVESDTYRLLMSAGLSFDTALLEAAKPVLRRQKRAQAILDDYVQNFQAEAPADRVEAERLASARLIELLHLSELTPLAELPIEESFLVVLSYASRQA